MPCKREGSLMWMGTMLGLLTEGSAHRYRIVFTKPDCPVQILFHVLRGSGSLQALTAVSSTFSGDADPWPGRSFNCPLFAPLHRNRNPQSGDLLHQPLFNDFSFSRSELP